MLEKGVGVVCVCTLVVLIGKRLVIAQLSVFFCWNCTSDWREEAGTSWAFLGEWKEKTRKTVSLVPDYMTYAPGRPLGSSAAEILRCRAWEESVSMSLSLESCSHHERRAS